MKNPSLFDLAFTHSSYANEKGLPDLSNQRLEYLGDSVLDLIVNEYLYTRYPDRREGELGRMKAAVVSRSTLSEISFETGLGSVLLLGRGEEKSGGARRSSNLADALEAFAAALYLDQGLEKSRDLLLPLFQKKIAAFDKPEARDPKSILQELSQKKMGKRPSYRLISEAGPGHKKQFVYAACIEEKEYGRGSGTSRKKAEQAAAREALEKLRREKNG